MSEVLPWDRPLKCAVCGQEVTRHTYRKHVEEKHPEHLDRLAREETEKLVSAIQRAIKEYSL